MRHTSVAFTDSILNKLLIVPVKQSIVSIKFIIRILKQA